MGVEKAVRLLEGRDSCTCEMSQRWAGAGRASVKASTRVIRRIEVDIESKTSRKSLFVVKMKVKVQIEAAARCVKNRGVIRKRMGAWSVVHCLILRANRSLVPERQYCFYVM